jgi:hypothetical protein
MQIKKLWISITLLVSLIAFCVYTLKVSRQKYLYYMSAIATMKEASQMLFWRSRSFMAQIHKEADAYKNPINESARNDAEMIFRLSDSLFMAKERDKFNFARSEELLHLCAQVLAKENVDLPKSASALSDQCLSSGYFSNTPKDLPNVIRSVSSQVLTNASLKHLMTRQQGSSMPFDSLMVVVIPYRASTCLKDGDTWEGEIFLAQYTPLHGLRTTVNGVDIPVTNGCGHFEQVVTSKTKRKILVSFISTNPFSGEVETYRNEYELPICYE